MASPSYSHVQYSKKYKKHGVYSLIDSGASKIDADLAYTFRQKVALTEASIKILVFVAKSLAVIALAYVLVLLVDGLLIGEWFLNPLRAFQPTLDPIRLVPVLENKYKLANGARFLFVVSMIFPGTFAMLTVLHFIFNRMTKIIPDRLYSHFCKLKHFIASAINFGLIAWESTHYFFADLTLLNPAAASPNANFNFFSVAVFFNNYFLNLTLEGVILMTLKTIAVARILILIQKIFLVEIAYSFDERSTRKRKETVDPIFNLIEELRAAYVSQKISPQDLAEGEGLVDYYGKLLAASKEMAQEIFAAVKSISGTQGLTLYRDNFKSILGEEKTNMMFDFFEGPECQDLSIDQFERGVEIVYQEKLNIQNTLNDNDEIIVRIDELMVLFWRCVIIFSTCLIFEFNSLYSGLLGLGSAFAIAQTVKDLAKDVSDSVILLFFYHPFDIGDVINVDGTLYTVKKVGFLITTCQEGNNSLVYIKNSKLANSVIKNFRRSGDQEESIALFVHTNTPMELLDALESELNKFLYANPKDYYPRCSFGPVQVLTSERTTVSVSYVHKSNFQDRKIYGSRCKRFNLELFEAMKRLGIQAAPPA